MLQRNIILIQSFFNQSNTAQKWISQQALVDCTSISWQLQNHWIIKSRERSRKGRNNSFVSYFSICCCSLHTIEDELLGLSSSSHPKLEVASTPGAGETMLWETECNIREKRRCLIPPHPLLSLGRKFLQKSHQYCSIYKGICTVMTTLM